MEVTGEKHAEGRSVAVELGWLGEGSGGSSRLRVVISHLCQKGSFSSLLLSAGLGEYKRSSRSLKQLEQKNWAAKFILGEAPSSDSPASVCIRFPLLLRLLWRVRGVKGLWLELLPRCHLLPAGLGLGLFQKGLQRGTWCLCSVSAVSWLLPDLYSWSQTGITTPFYDVVLIRQSKEIDADLKFILGSSDLEAQPHRGKDNGRGSESKMGREQKLHAKRVQGNHQQRSSPSILSTIQVHCA